jgi:dipeptidyl aminopeptidase/acylaminoacyl peptidase
MPAGAAPSLNGDLQFSKDGRRLFFGTAPAPTPVPSQTPIPLAVDLWSYRDSRLQSEQKHAAADDRKRTYRAVVDIASGRFAQLGAPELATIETNDNPAFALGSDLRPYEIERSWTGDDAADISAVALATGARRPLARKAVEVSLSPGGAFTLLWDRSRRHWIAVRMRDCRRTVLAAHAGVNFFDETDDHPAPPPPYGLGPWLAGDRGVIVYDRYDPWLVDPTTGSAVNLTHGFGRGTQTVYSVLDTDPDGEPLPARSPFLLSLRDQHRYASGFARVAADGGVPRTLLRVDKTVGNRAALDAPLHEQIDTPLQARNADRLVFTEESFREFRDWWATDRSFAHPRRVTDANPQLHTLRWGHEALISYRSAAGVPLRAVLLTPDGFNPHKRYPTLVYFYEKWSDQFHTFYAPVPRYPTIARYVSHGYVVVLPDIVYRAGHPGESALDCLLAAVDAVTARGIADPHRIGITGHSWSGYQVNYVLTRTNRFRAAEAGAAVANMTSAYGGIRLESGYVRESQYERGQSRIGATPWDRPDLYLENSGLFHVRNVHTPYLTMHNDADTAVPFEQGVEFITAMRRLGKPAYMFVFNGKEHNLRDTPADRDALLFWTVHFDEWFDYWLTGAPRPAWFDGVDYLHRGQRNVRPLFGEP